jgi:hypothetical protein
MGVYLRSHFNRASCPPIRHVDKIFKKAERFKGKEIEQLKIHDGDN